MPSIELPRVGGGKVVVRYDAPRQRWSIQVYTKARETLLNKEDLTGESLVPLLDDHADLNDPRTKKIRGCARMGLGPSLLGVN